MLTWFLINSKKVKETLNYYRQKKPSKLKEKKNFQNSRKKLQFSANPVGQLAENRPTVPMTLCMKNWRPNNKTAPSRQSVRLDKESFKTWYRAAVASRDAHSLDRASRILASDPRLWTTHKGHRLVAPWKPLFSWILQQNWKRNVKKLHADWVWNHAPL